MAILKRLQLLSALPEEIIEEILKRLPVRSLVRFSCTCKRWRCLIFSDSKFNKSHIHLAKRPSWKFQEIDCSRSFDRTVDCDLNIVRLLPKEALPGFRPFVFCSCKGLLLCYYWGDRAYVLWNPYTNSVRRISADDGGFGIGCTSRLYGLSYDPASDDYKAVLIDAPSPYVFSVRRNSWKKLSDLTFEIPNTFEDGWSRWDRLGITTDNGMCHWQIKVHPRSLSIICFDPNVEKFKEVPLPWCSSGRLFQIGVLDGCLSLIHINVVWVMKEYGFWTKMHVLELSYIERMGEINTYKPLGYNNSTKDQVVMIARTYRPRVYNLTRDQVELIPRTDPSRDIVWRFRIADVSNGVLRGPTDEEQLEGLFYLRNCHIVPYTESLLCPWLDL